MLWPMAILAALGLVLSVVVHASTFFGINPSDHMPGVFFLHVLIFPPLAAGIFYTNHATGKDENGLDAVMAAAPMRLGTLTGCFFVYAFINFILFLVLQEGTPEFEEGRYYLHSHGNEIRDITEAEYHRAEAFVLRGFSGHWMLFYTAALTCLLGSDRILRGVAPSRPTDDGRKHWWQDTKPTPEQIAHNKTELAKRVSRPDAIRSLVLFLGCAVILVWGQPLLSFLAALSLAPFGVKQLRRYQMRTDGSFESSIGCLALIPIIVVFMFRFVPVISNAIYIAIAVGLAEASTGSVWVVRGADPMQLSNGSPMIHYWAYNASFIFTGFAGFIFCVSGMIYLTETFGRWYAQKPSETSQ